MLGLIASLGAPTETDIREGGDQSADGSQNAPRVSAEAGAEGCTGKCYGQWQNIGQIGYFADTAGSDADPYPIANHGADSIGHPIRLRAATEHLGQLLTSATTLFMASSTAALLNLDLGHLSV